MINPMDKFIDPAKEWEELEDKVVADFHLRRDEAMRAAFLKKFGEEMTPEHMKSIGYKSNDGNYWMVYTFDKRDFFAIGEPKTIRLGDSFALQCQCFEL